MNGEEVVNCKVVKKRKTKKSVRSKQEAFIPATPPRVQNNDEDDELMNSPFSKNRTKDEYKRGDLIIAKWRRFPFWPAIFCRYTDKRRKKKARVHFFECLTEDEIKKTLVTVVPSNIKPYCKYEKEKLKSMSTHVEDLLRSFERAEEYQRKKALGKVDDFFNGREEDDDDDDDDEDGAEEAEEDDETNAQDDNGVVANSWAYDDDDSGKSDDNVAKENLDSSATASQSCPNIDNLKLMEVIRESRPYLQQVMGGEVHSERHHIFFHGKRKEKDKLKWAGGFYTLHQNEIEEVQDLLMKWFLNDNIFKNVHSITYIHDVWIPEVIIRGISKTKSLSYEDAEKEYLD